MSKSSHLGLLVLCLLLSGTTRLLVVAAGHSEDRVEARNHAIYFTADFLSSQFSYEAGRHFDFKPCADRVYAGERDRSLRYLFGPTMGKATNHSTYLESKTKSQFQLTAEFSVKPYMPFPAGRVYGNLVSMSPVVSLSSTVSRKELTTALDAYISVPSPFVDQTILGDQTEARLEMVFFKTSSKPTKKMELSPNSILEQIKKTGLFEQGRQIRRQQMIAAYLGKDHTLRTYSQRVLEESKPRDGEEMYWLTLPEQSDPFYPRLFKDSQWTFELVIKFLTYAIPPLQESHDNRSRISFFSHYLSSNGIIPGIAAKFMLQPFSSTSLFFTHAFLQSQKYRFLEAKSTISVVLYQESFIGDDVLSPPIHRFTDAPSIILGARRTLLQDKDSVVGAVATIDFAVKRSVKLSSLRRLKMPFRIPKGVISEMDKRAEALRQLAEMTELNGLEEDFDFQERIFALISSSDI